MKILPVGVVAGGAVMILAPLVIDSKYTNVMPLTTAVNNYNDAQASYNNYQCEEHGYHHNVTHFALDPNIDKTLALICDNAYKKFEQAAKDKTRAADRAAAYDTSFKVAGAIFLSSLVTQLLVSDPAKSAAKSSINFCQATYDKLVATYKNSQGWRLINLTAKQVQQLNRDDVELGDVVGTNGEATVAIRESDIGTFYLAATNSTRSSTDSQAPLPQASTS